MYNVSSSGLDFVADLPLYGVVSAMFLYRAHGTSEPTDRLFVCLSDHRVFTLVWQEGTLRTPVTGALRDAVGEDAVVQAVLDVGQKCVTMTLTDSTLKVVPIEASSVLQDAFNVRIPARDAASLCPIIPKSLNDPPSVCYIARDGNKRTLHSHSLMLKNRTIQNGPIADITLDAGAVFVRPLCPEGALVIGETECVWVGPNNARARCKFPADGPLLVAAVEKIDADGSRWLLGDEGGNLWLVAAHGVSSGTVSRLSIEHFGVACVPNTITYLDSGVVFMGGAFGDSWLIRLLEQRDVETGNFFETLATYTNLGPITDMCVVDLDGQGQGQLVTCSGAFNMGSLRVVRNGIGINLEADLPLPNITGLWSMRQQTVASYDTYLCLSFASQTIFLAMEGDDDLAELNDSGDLLCDRRTLYCGTCIGDLIVQITTGAVRLVQPGNRMALQDEWKPAEGTQITVCCSNGLSQIVVVLGGMTLVLLRIQGMRLIEQGRVQLDHEVACADMSLLQPQQQESSLLAVGFWGDYSVRLFDLPSLRVLATHPIQQGAVIPRSVRLAVMEGEARLLVGLGDGHLVHFLLDPTRGYLHDRKSVPLGTKGVQLTPFYAPDGALNVFAGCDRPTVVYSSSHKVICSNVNQHNVSFVAPFHTSLYPHCLAMATSEALIIGSMDKIQKLHIRSHPLGEMARRIAYHAPARAFAIGTASAVSVVHETNPVVNHVRLLDEVTFEALASFALLPSESVCSVASSMLGAQQVVLVGTAMVNPTEPEPSAGRLLVFRSSRQAPGDVIKKLEPICIREESGAVFGIAGYTEGRVVCTVNARVVVLEANVEEDKVQLKAVAEHFGHVVALHVKTRGEFILVGDLMRSVSLLRLDPVSHKLVTVARDYGSVWLTSVDFLGEDVILSADNECNLLLHARGDDHDGEVRLREVGCFHVGEIVNSMREGRLVMPDPTIPAAELPPKPVLFGGASGTVGAVQPITKEQYEFFKRLEEKMAATVASVGGLKHSDWRMAKYVSRQRKPHEGFVDGDICEAYLDLKPEEAAKVAAELEMTPQELTKRVEDMARSIH